MASLRPVSSRVFSRLFRTSLRSQAKEVIEIAPATVREVNPAISLPDEFDRIVRTVDESGPNELRRMRDAHLKQGPAFAYRVDDALIADGSVLLSRACGNFQSTKRRFAIGGIPEFFKEAALCSSSVIEQYFAHWLIDGLAQELLAQNRGLTPLTFAPKTTRFHEPGYRHMFDMPSRRIEDARVERLWIFDDWELTEDRVARIEHLRDRLRSAIAPTSSKRVFIARGKKGAARELVNEAEIIEALRARGFTILSPEHEAPEVIAAHLHDAVMVVSVEGSAFSHAIVAGPPDMGIFVIQPPKRFSSIWKSYCDVLGMNFGFTVADPVGEQSFSQPVDRLLRGIDLFETTLAKA